MKKFMKGLGIFILATLGVVTVSYVGFGVWTEAKHDKSAYQYIKDEIQEAKDDKKQDEVKTESEDGSVEATAMINF